MKATPTRIDQFTIPAIRLNSGRHDLARSCRVRDFAFSQLPPDAVAAVMVKGSEPPPELETETGRVRAGVPAK